MAQIQRSAVEPDKRNFISRIFNARKDKDAVAAWRSELDRIVHVFEVRSLLHSLPALLIVHLQTELAIHTHLAVSDVREDVGDIRVDVGDIREDVGDIRENVGDIRGGVVDIRGGVVDIREDVANTRELVSDIHRTMLKGQEGIDNRNNMVGNHGILFMIRKVLQLLQTQARFAISAVVVDRGPYLSIQNARRIASPTAGSLFRTG